MGRTVLPGDSSRDQFNPDRWRSPLQPLNRPLNQQPKKVTLNHQVVDLL